MMLRPGAFLKSTLNGLLRVFRAGRVRRWHTHPVMAGFDDRLDAHQGRVARYILRLHPEPSFNLLKYALTHDDAEHVVGDLAPQAKRLLGIKIALDEAERMIREEMWGKIPITAHEARWVHFCDCLDRWMWVRHHAAPVLESEDWPEVTAWLRDEARALDADEAVCLLSGVEVVG